MEKTKAEYEMWRDLYIFFDTYWDMEDTDANWDKVVKDGQKHVNKYAKTTARDIATDLFVAVTSAIETKVMGRRDK